MVGAVATVFMAVIVAIPVLVKIVRLVLVAGRQVKHKCQQLGRGIQVAMAMRIVDRYLRVQCDLFFPTGYYYAYLNMLPTVPSKMRSETTERQLVAELGLDNHRWLKDILLASALESLSDKGRVVKGPWYEPHIWPVRDNTKRWFRFQPKRPDMSTRNQIEEIEANSKCFIYQNWVKKCLTDSRFGEEFPQVPESALPCQRCWEHEQANQQ